MLQVRSCTLLNNDGEALLQLRRYTLLNNDVEALLQARGCALLIDNADMLLQARHTTVQEAPSVHIHLLHRVAVLPNTTITRAAPDSTSRTICTELHELHISLRRAVRVDHTAHSAHLEDRRTERLYAVVLHNPHAVGAILELDVQNVATEDQHGHVTAGERSRHASIGSEGQRRGCQARESVSGRPHRRGLQRRGYRRRAGGTPSSVHDAGPRSERSRCSTPLRLHRRCARVPTSAAVARSTCSRMIAST